jgi:hypothetical protein
VREINTGCAETVAAAAAEAAAAVACSA